MPEVNTNQKRHLSNVSSLVPLVSTKCHNHNFFIFHSTNGAIYIIFARPCVNKSNFEPIHVFPSTFM